MDFKFKFQTIGYNMAILGKFKGWTFNIKYILEVKSVRLLIIRVTKDHIGNKHKPL